MSDQRLVQLVFKAWSSFYDHPLFQRPFYRRVHAEVLRAVDEAALSPAAVVDLGCGTAQLTVDLAARFPGAAVVGVDLSDGMLSAARRRAPSLRLLRGSAYALPLATGAVDLLTSTISYHWYLEHERALAEIRRVLRPGGRFVLATMTTRLLRGRFGEARLTDLAGHLDDLAAAGFSVEKRTHVRPAVEVFTARLSR